MGAVVLQHRRAAALRVGELLVLEDAAIEECEKLLNGIKDSQQLLSGFSVIAEERLLSSFV